MYPFGIYFMSKKESNKRYYDLNREKLLLQKKEYRIKNKSKIYENNKRYRLKVKDTVNEYARKYYSLNKEKIKLSQKKWEVKNPIKKTERSRRFRLLNKDKLKSIKQKRLKNDLNFRISTVLRSRVWAYIKNNKKTGSVIRDLGCSIDELKIHLENQFRDGMNWDNWGLHGWHIDHIKPLSKFDLQNRDEFLKACHYTNMQPLWWDENIKKGNR